MSDTDNSLYANVAVDLPLSPNSEKNYYYKIPDELKDSIKPGAVVHIPFGRQELNAYAVEILSSENLDVSNIKFKSIYQLVQNEIWDENFLKLAKEISDYYFTNIGTVLSASVSTDIFDNFTHEVELIEEHFDKTKFSASELFILGKLVSSKKHKLAYKSIYQNAKFSKSKLYSYINGLKNKGVIRVNLRQTKKTRKYNKEKNWQGLKSLKEKETQKITLNQDQLNAFEKVKSSILESKEKTYLLHGVTGSGKTEVYLNLINEALNKNKTALYLVPEIYLVPQTYERLKAKFGEESIVIWHSNLSKGERLENWEKILSPDSKVKVILGARSAILSPLKNVGVIIIDEAHESSYKQSSPAPRYDALKVAKMRSKIEKCPIVLGTATPNSEDYYSAIEENSLLELPERIRDLPMPKVEIIDVKNEPKNYGKVLSKTLENSIYQTLERKEQVILLLNRRGYASNIFCKACGESVYCKSCSVPVVYHKNEDLMVCHHCGFKKSYKQTYGSSKSKCGNCSSDQFDYIGIGTQQLEEEIKNTFPQAKTIRVDKDMLKKKDTYLKLWDEFSSGKADILIGTQLVAKGIDLPNVTLVGVLSPDTILNFPDFISYEKGFQLLTQVSGRAGRGDKPGKVYIQTYKADESLYSYVRSHDYLAFYKNEIKAREEHTYPPFTTITRIVFQSHNESKCLEEASKALEKLNGILKSEPCSQSTILGPAPCFFSKLQGKFRYHILLKIQEHQSRKKVLDKFINNEKFSKDVDIVVDIDSNNLL